jgi:hypothetical protein
MLKRSFSIAALSALTLTGSCKDGPNEPHPSTLQYDIEVRFFGTPMSASQQQLFISARDRLVGIVKGDIVASAPDASHNLNECPNVPQSENIPLNFSADDVIIYASIRSIDGPGSIIASAGPCFTRPAGGKNMTAIGVMSFDSADLQQVQQGGSLQDVITHEMLHVLGVGTLWSDNTHNLVADTGTSNPRYLGANARAACVAAGGSTACANHVPVEGTPAAVGTRDSHWREATFDKEMMTGTLDNPAPLSAITIGALKDLSFTVDESKADAYTVPSGGLLPRVAHLAFPNGWEQITRPVAQLKTAPEARFPRR